MNGTPTVWTLKGFCSYFGFVHSKMLDHAFAWVLGAGASKPSGIPTGSELVDRWLKELHERLDSGNVPFEKWAKAPNLGIEGFDLQSAASFYPRVYERRFRDNPDEGYACLEDLMSEQDPSPGYSILAKTMETQRHKVVITTNFDNLVADALSIYTNTFPFVCGHESLTGFVRAAMRRPLVCKIHRDLLLAPKNDPRSVKRLHEAWAGTLRSLFAHYTPIFIGYGGNDDSLMDLLESLDPGEIKGQIVWCYYDKGEGPSRRIKELVAQHQGALVPVPNFDLLMVLLGAEMGIQPLDYVLEERAKERTAKYQERIFALDTTGYPNVATALVATFERAGGWLAWELKARAELDGERREAIYRQGIQLFPKSYHLYIRFACFMMEQQKKFAEAAQLFGRAYELNSNDALTTSNFGEVLMIGDRMDEALRLFQQAWILNGGTSNRTIYSVLALDIGIVERCTRCDDSQALGRLKTLLLDGFERGTWSFDAVLESTKAKLSVEDHSLYSALAEAILDAGRITTLDSFERWRSVAPIPLNQPWEVKAS
jgi:protein O-mannosyl-transferase